MSEKYLEIGFRKASAGQGPIQVKASPRSLWHKS